MFLGKWEPRFSSYKLKLSVRTQDKNQTCNMIGGKVL